MKEFFIPNAPEIASPVIYTLRANGKSTANAIKASFNYY